MKASDGYRVGKEGPVEMMTQFLYHLDPTFIPKVKSKFNRLKDEKDGDS